MTWLTTFYLGAMVFSGLWVFAKMLMMALGVVTSFSPQIKIKSFELSVETLPMFLFALFTALFFHGIMN